LESYRTNTHTHTHTHTYTQTADHWQWLLDNSRTGQFANNAGNRKRHYVLLINFFHHHQHHQLHAHEAEEQIIHSKRVIFKVPTDTKRLTTALGGVCELYSPSLDLFASCPVTHGPLKWIGSSKRLAWGRYILPVFTGRRHGRASKMAVSTTGREHGCVLSNCRAMLSVNTARQNRCLGTYYSSG